MQSAKPIPRRISGRSAGCCQSGSVRRSQPIARSAWRDALLGAAARHRRQILGRDLVGGAALAEARRDVEAVADARPSCAAGTRSDRARARARCPPCGTRARTAPAARRSRASRPDTGGVRVDDVAAVALRRAVVRGEAAQPGRRLHRERVRAVGAGARDDAQVLRDEPAVRVDAGAVGERLRMARPRGGELLLARQLELDRPAGREHEMADDVLDQHLLLAAEAAADARLDDADPLDRQAEERRDHAPHVERHLGRRCGGRAARRRRASRSVTWGSSAQCATRWTWKVCSKTCSARANAPSMSRTVLPSTCCAMFRAASRMPGESLSSWMTGAPGSTRLGRVEDGRQHLVGDLDQPAGLLGQLGRLGRDGGDAVADVAHLVVEADLIPRVRVRPALARRGVLHARRVQVVDDGVDARQRARGGVVDRDDPRVRVRAAQHLRVQQPARLDVGRERGACPSRAAARRPCASDVATTARLRNVRRASTTVTPGGGGSSPRSSAAARRTPSTVFTYAPSRSRMPESASRIAASSGSGSRSSSDLRREDDRARRVAGLDRAGVDERLPGSGAAPRAAPRRPPPSSPRGRRPARRAGPRPRRGGRRRARRRRPSRRSRSRSAR